eukprot:792341-Pelagomonas_calceolata.AAC.1
MGKQACLRKGIGIPSNPGEAPASYFLMWDPTIPSKRPTLLLLLPMGGRGVASYPGCVSKDGTDSLGLLLLLLLGLEEVLGKR